MRSESTMNHTIAYSFKEHMNSCDESATLIVVTSESNKSQFPVMPLN